MRGYLLLPTLVFGLALGAAAAQPPTPAPVPPGPATPTSKADDKAAPGLPKVPAVPEFDVGFVDGSNVKVIVLEAAVAVTTKYGKLTVPLADLKRVELGFRYPEGVEAKLESAVERLAAPAYADREDAAKQVLELKQYAGAILKRAAQDDDAERRRRGDTVETADFTVRGRLDSPSFKVRTKQFGEAVVRIAEVRQFRAVAVAAAGGDIALDAALYSKLNWSGWLDTEVDVSANAPLEITCTGTIDQWPQEPGRYMSGPAGNGNASQNQQGNIRVMVPGQQFNPNRGM